MIAAVPMVQEEEAADEFRPKPELHEVEDARLRGAVGPKFVWCGGAMPEITKVVLKAAIEMMEEEFVMATAGAGSDETNELDVSGIWVILTFFKPMF